MSYRIREVEAPATTSSMANLEIEFFRGATEVVGREIEFSPVELSTYAAVAGKTLSEKYPGRTALTTAEAALVLGRKKGTLLVWASNPKENTPIRPVKVGRKNMWPIAELQRLL